MALITIEDILQRKKYMENKSNEDIEIEVENFGTMTFRTCSIDDYFDILESSNKDKDAELLYYCSIEPNFRDDKLINALGCKSNPAEIANKFLNKLEIQQIATIILDKSGIKDVVKVVTKN